MTYIKHILFVVVLVSAGFGIGTSVFAAEDGTTIFVSQDFGVQNPGILPTSPFYFFKEFGRGIQGLLTRDTVKRAELESKISNEKAAELQEVQVKHPEKAGAIQKALQNYQNAQNALQARLEKVARNSNNPNVDALLAKIAERTITHEQLMVRLLDKEEISQEMKDSVEKTKEKIHFIAEKASEKEDSSMFAERLQKEVEKTGGGDLKMIGAIEVLDRIIKKAPDAAKQKLQVVREKIKTKAETRIEELIKENPERAGIILERLPGVAEKKAEFFNELRENASPKVMEALDRAQVNLKEQKIEMMENRRNREEDRTISPPVLGSPQEDKDKRKATDLKEKLDLSPGPAPRAIEKVNRIFEQNQNPGTSQGNAIIAPEKDLSLHETGVSPEDALYIEEKEKAELQNKPVIQPEISKQELLQRQLKDQMQQLDALQKQLQEKSL